MLRSLDIAVIKIYVIDGILQKLKSNSIIKNDTTIIRCLDYWLYSQYYLSPLIFLQDENRWCCGLDWVSVTQPFGLELTHPLPLSLPK